MHGEKRLPFILTEGFKLFIDDWWKETKSRKYFLRISLFPAPFSSPSPPLFFVTGSGSSPLLAQQSLNGSCMFCWVPSSRTWAAWRCPPHPGRWPQGEPGPSGCPPSLARPLWRTWRALWPCWKTKARALRQTSLKKTETRHWSMGVSYFIHSSLRHNRQWDTTSTDKFSLDRATSSLFSKVGPAKKGGLVNMMYIWSSIIWSVQGDYLFKWKYTIMQMNYKGSGPKLSFLGGC